MQVMPVCSVSTDVIRFVFRTEARKKQRRFTEGEGVSPLWSHTLHDAHASSAVPRATRNSRGWFGLTDDGEVRSSD